MPEYPKMIIDPPVGPYSTPEELEDWIAELEAMPDNNDVRLALTEARTWLEDRRARDS